ncbi:hypothetical protein Y032_0180g791 [Ancylostoma ceylanicum]|uniref:Receptor L-domain domain-containing protein n=1 Tax=Ancylostoma ceylanicum TaxID=53326 RepID=A0A016STD0_9BILA|nr:hypothetical protein Y032_0180g791 [Ancylostoma ceylanicum]
MIDHKEKITTGFSNFLFRGLLSSVYACPKTSAAPCTVTCGGHPVNQVSASSSKNPLLQTTDPGGMDNLVDNYQLFQGTLISGPALVLANNSGLTELSLERLESLQAATDVPHLVDVKLVEGQYITDMNILIRPSGNRVQISHVNDIRKMAENHENNIWLAFLVVGCGCLVLVLLGVIAFVLFARKDKNKVTRTQETRSLPSLSTPSKTVQSGTQ